MNEVRFRENGAEIYIPIDRYKKSETTGAPPIEEFRSSDGFFRAG
jgi:hypothetical protein